MEALGSGQAIHVPRNHAKESGLESEGDRELSKDVNERREWVRDRICFSKR